MKKGITLESETEGTGAVATRGSYVTIRYTGFLNRGEIIREEQTSQIKLGAREIIAGLEYTIEGMKVGGKGSLMEEKKMEHPQEKNALCFPFRVFFGTLF